MATKNKGEVSEFYAFVSILGNRVVELVDGSLHLLGDQVHFLKVFRKEDVEISYELTDDGKLCITKNGSTDIVDRQLVRNYANQLLNLIQSSDESIDESNPKIGQLKNLLLTDRLSAKSSDKSDFTGVVTSPHQPHTHTLGFSVKSHLGAPPTLVNANKDNSLFLFEIVAADGRRLTEQDRLTLSEIKTQIEEKRNIRPRIALLRKHGYVLKFSRTSSALDYTLRIIDSRFPEILAELLLEHYSSLSGRKQRTLSDLVDICCSHYRNTACFSGLGDTEREIRMSVQYKMQNFLLAFSTGATVSKKWDGKDLANGGFIVVLQDGRVVCLELFTRNSIGQYLLENTVFDTPSTKRHDGGRLDLSGDTPMFGLQLQVRFKDHKSAETLEPSNQALICE